MRTLLLLLLGMLPLAALAETELWDLTLYADFGYGKSNREPSDDRWASKSSTAELNDPTLYLAMANIRKNTTKNSRWGFEFGVQTGDDSEGLVTSAPPPANEPFSNADDLRHLYRANVSYLFGDDRGLKLTGGLINSFIGYESYLAIDNPNYTRGYLSDNAPYFLFGLEAMWDVSETSNLGFYLVNGYNYLADPNDVPSLGFQWNWRPNAELSFTQNLYYGSDQDDTDIEFWRFFGETSLEWSRGPWLLAGAINYGTEKQAELAGQPRYNFGAAALWVQWSANERLRLALRPEFYWDDDGLITGGAQTLTGYTGTVKYQLTPGRQQIDGVLEVRVDGSTRAGGNFADKPNDTLRASQTTIFAGLLWRFET